MEEEPRSGVPLPVFFPFGAMRPTGTLPPNSRRRHAPHEPSLEHEERQQDRGYHHHPEGEDVPPLERRERMESGNRQR